MATPTKTSKPTRTAATKQLAPDKSKAAPRIRTKADAEPEAPAKPKLSKPGKASKEAVNAGAEPKPARAKAAAKAKPAILPISAEHRRHYIELAAFYIAERRGFSGGNSLEDWLQAEAEIDQLLQQGKINR